MPETLGAVVVQLDRLIDELAARSDSMGLREAYVALATRQARLSLMAVLALTPSPAPRWMPPAEAAKRLDCSVKTLGRRRRQVGYRDFIVEGEVRGFKVDSAKFEEFLRRR